MVTNDTLVAYSYGHHRALNYEQWHDFITGAYSDHLLSASQALSVRVVLCKQTEEMIQWTMQFNGRDNKIVANHRSQTLKRQIGAARKTRKRAFCNLVHTVFTQTNFVESLKKCTKISKCI